MSVNLFMAIQLIAVSIPDLNKVADPLVTHGHVSCVVNEMQFTDQFHTSIKQTDCLKLLNDLFTRHMCNSCLA